MPHGWASANRENGSDLADASPGREDLAPIVEVVPEVIAAPIVDAQITAVVEEEAAAPRPKRAAKARKPAAARKSRYEKSEGTEGTLGTPRTTWAPL